MSIRYTPGCSCLELCFYLAAGMIILVITYYVVNLMVMAGAGYGAFVAVKNYIQAFYSNVRPERVTA
ncbi:MAG: hypothetical protein U0002_04515 [Thermoanaerobaculia bacterium]